MGENKFFVEVGNFSLAKIHGKQTQYKKIFFSKTLEKTWNFDGINVTIRSKLIEIYNFQFAMLISYCFGVAL